MNTSNLCIPCLYRGDITERYDLHELYDIATLKSYDFYTAGDLQLFANCDKVNSCLNAYSKYDAYLRENGLSRGEFR
jgi:hypothetical protein